MPYVLPADTETPAIQDNWAKRVVACGLPDETMRFHHNPTVNKFYVEIFCQILSRKTPLCFIGFQTGKDVDKEENLSSFNNVDVRNILVMLNSTRYPAADNNLPFPKQEFSGRGLWRCRCI